MQFNTTCSNHIDQIKVLLLILLVLILVAPVTGKAEGLVQLDLDSNGDGNLGRGENPFISSNGRFVVFNASGLLPADVHGFQVYLYDRETKTLELVSQAADGTSANMEVTLPDYSGARVVSEDGRFVVFRTRASNLPGGANNKRHVYLRDRQTGTTSLVSRSSTGETANQRSWDYSIAPDGWGVIFNSSANNLDAGDNDNFINTYLHDLRELGDRTTKLACFDKNGAKITQCNDLSLSCTGLMTFITADDDAGVDDLHFGLDVYFGNPLAGNNVIISVGASDQPADSIQFKPPVISCDGQRIAFSTQAKLSLADDDADWDLYVRDNDTGIARLIRGPSDTSLRPTEVTMSPNGKWIAFRTVEALDPIDTNGIIDVYAVHFSLDRILGEIRLVSQNDGEQGNGQSLSVAIADNGAVAFESGATNFTDVIDVNGVAPNIFMNRFIEIYVDGFE